jgi:hypothetical protein
LVALRSRILGVYGSPYRDKKVVPVSLSAFSPLHQSSGSLRYLDRAIHGLFHLSHFSCITLHIVPSPVLYYVLCHHAVLTGQTEQDAEATATWFTLV